MSKWIDADALIEAMGEEPYVWTDSAEEMWAEAVEQREHDILYEPTYDLDDGSM